MSFEGCKAGLQDCPYADSERCKLCGKDQRKRQRARAGRTDQRTTAKYRNGLPEYMIPRTIGVDGEGHEGRYFLLAAADEHGWHSEAWNDKGLRTAQCFDFLIALPDAVKWGFAFNYDVNMMLVDVPLPMLRTLHTTSHLRWRQYRIEWMPKKKLMVSRYKMEGLKQTERIGSCTVWDMYPWQQCSFVSWLQKNELAPESVIESIAVMKKQRPDFNPEMKDEILQYCLQECSLLAKGATLLHTLLKAQNIRIFQFYSPATMSKQLMKENNVDQHHPSKSGMRRTIHVKDFPIEQALEAAYFGGRAETSLCGPVDGPLYQYDIRSAYPYSATLLPCWRHGEWRSGAGAPIHPWSLLWLKWQPLPKKVQRSPMMWGPLPVRPGIGSLRWPTTGRGVYWGTEVLQVQHLARIKIMRHLRWFQECNCQPFDYLATLYRQRAALKAAGDAREYINKLALNATYGALAEHPQKADLLREPRWRNVGWAGWITAHTRGMIGALLDDTAVMVATDCVIARRPLAVPVGTALGEWDATEWDGGFIIGPGVYFLRRNDEWVIHKSRGYTHGSLTIENVLKAWESLGRNGSVTIDRTIFVGLGAALHRLHGITGDPLAQLWRTFHDSPAQRRFTLEPRREWRSEDPWDGTSYAPSHEYLTKMAMKDKLRLEQLRILIGASDATPYDQLRWSNEVAALEDHGNLFDDGEINA